MRLTPPEPIEARDRRDVDREAEAEARRERQAELELEDRRRARKTAGAELDALEYDELQRLALLHGIRANQSPDVLADALEEVLES